MYTSELATAAQDGFVKLWDNRADPGTRQAIDGIQKALQCCGSNNPSDWGQSIPLSCCAEGTTQCLLGGAHPTGCRDKLYSLVRDSGMLIAWVAVVFGAFEVRTKLT